MATITITFADSKANKMARGIDPRAYEENPPQTIADAEALIEAWTIEHYKVAFRRGDKLSYADGFVPEDDPDPQL
jgi:hypothetical protein